ncbi:MAG TPA: ATP-binding protein [Vicinamibacterales bacterium]|nr:ATP-binding protein [Vicinamibacterales bacterium]
MSLRDRLLIGLLVSLAALAANEAIYLWSVNVRAGSLATLDAVREGENGLAALRRDVEVLHRQVVVGVRLSGANLPSTLAFDRPSVESRLKRIDAQIRNLSASPDAPAPSGARPLIDACEHFKQQLQDYFDADDTVRRAVHLAGADAIGWELLDRFFPAVQMQMQARSAEARRNLNDAEDLTYAVTLAGFVLTALLTTAGAYFLGRHLSRGLAKLKEGASLIGSMNLEYRIPITSADELGGLAGAFNEMAEQLSRAQAEHSRVNRDLARSEARYRSLVERSVFGIYRTDERQRFRDVNPALVQMLGYHAASDLLTLDLMRDVYVNPQDHDRLMRSYRDKGVVAGFDLEWRRADGAVITVRLSGSASDVNNPDAGMDMIVEDVTERKALGEQLRHAQKMQAVGRLAGGVAHDFNNLLTVIKGHVEVMLDRLNRDHPLRRRVVEVQRAADRAAVVTSQLLAFSRRQVLAPRVLDVNALIDNMATMVEPLLGERISLSTELDPRLGCVHADPSQIEQVLMNLVVNARDAMPTGGKLSIRTVNIDVNQGRRAARVGAQKLEIEPGPYVLISVADTGVGMDEETRRQAFEPFFTTKGPGQGTGLGLSMVYGIVRQSGGDIGVLTGRGRGTTMMIYLPRVDRVAEPVRESVVPRAPLGSETVLLVEDDEAVRELIQDALMQSGYRVLSTGAPGEAERVCREFDGPIHLFLADVVLPEMDGPELSRKLLGLRPDMSVLFISGYAAEVIVQRGVQCGETALVPKPFSPDALARKVREVLDSRAQPA